MTLTNKVFLILGFVVTLGLLFFIAFRQNEISNRQKAIETQVIAQKELADSIVRSQNEYATRKDVEQFIKDNNVNLQAIQKDLEKLSAEIVAANVVTAVSKGYVGVNLPSTGTGPVNPNPVPVDPNNPDPYGYFKRQQNFDLNENFNVKVPIGSVGFSAWQPQPWSINIFPREYNVSTIIAVDENQRHIVYNKFTINVNGKNYDIQIAKAQTKEIYPEARFSWWNPRLFAGMDVGSSISNPALEATPSLNLGIMSYGQFKNQPYFSIFEVGLGYGMTSKRMQMLLTPFSYNIGRHLPLIDNLYVGPSVHVGTGGDISVMAGIRLGL
jgi:hypothetical protein